VDRVYAGPAFWGIGDAPAVMAAYRDFVAESPEQLACFVGLKTVPMADPFPVEHQGNPACALISCFNGSVEEGMAALAPLRDALPEPLFDWTGEMAFPDVQGLFDPLLRPGMQWYWRGDFVRELPDEAIAAHVQHARELRPGALSMMHLYPIDGAVHRVAPGDTAWHTRDATWSMVIAGVHADADQSAEVTRWTQSYWEAVHPYSADGGYVNFMMGDGTTDRLRATYGANYDRLVSVKTEYDPTNLFRSNQNIPPRTAS
jgi:FAD/FMN-containing dehydrogenase